MKQIGQVAGLLASLGVLAFWVSLLVAGPDAGPPFFVIAWCMMITTSVGVYASVFVKHSLMYAVFGLALPVGFYFLVLTEGPYRPIGYLTPLFLVSAILMHLATHRNPHST